MTFFSFLKECLPYALSLSIVLLNNHFSKQKDKSEKKEKYMQERLEKFYLPFYIHITSYLYILKILPDRGFDSLVENINTLIEHFHFVETTTQGKIIEFNIHLLISIEKKKRGQLSSEQRDLIIEKYLDISKAILSEYSDLSRKLLKTIPNTDIFYSVFPADILDEQRSMPK